MRSQKYGRVDVEHRPEGMADDEPCFVIRAVDALAIESVLAYAGLARAASSALSIATAEAEDESVRASRLQMLSVSATVAASGLRDWQEKHPELVKLPD